MDTEPTPAPTEAHSEQLVAVLHKLVVAVDALALITTDDADIDRRALAAAALARILRDGTVAALSSGYYAREHHM
jgi:hypothetical protein